MKERSAMKRQLIYAVALGGVIAAVATPLAAWAADHTHSMAGAIPVLALDMYEHSYHLDYGAAAAKYVDAFMENINWTNVARLRQAHAR